MSTPSVRGAVSRSYRFDRLIPGLGRLTRSSGTDRRSVFRRMDAMLTALIGQGRLDLVRAVHSGRLPALVLFDADRKSTRLNSSH